MVNLESDVMLAPSFIFTGKTVHMRKLFIALLIVPFVSIARKKQITLEDLYKSKMFEPDVVPGFFQQPLDSIIKPHKKMRKVMMRIHHLILRIG